jgi:RHS repeat-associated protein
MPISLRSAAFTPGPLDFAAYATGSGCGAINLAGGGYTDSFDSSQGTYTQTKTLAGGDIGVTANVTLSGGFVVNGSIAALNTAVGSCLNGAPGISLSGGAKATAGYLNLSAAPSFLNPPPVTAGSQDLSFTKNATLLPGNYRNIAVSGGATLTLSPGTYNINSISLSGNSILTFSPSGRVLITVAGNGVPAAINFSGGTIVNPSGIPLNLQFLYGGSLPTMISGGSASYAVVYAPNSSASLSGGSDWFGAIVARTLNDSGGTAIHYDRSLATLPTITAAVTPAPNAAGWNNTNATVSFACSDPVFAITSCNLPIQVTAEGANQVITGKAVDAAGLTSSTSATVNLDKTPPLISGAGSPPPNGAGWNNSNVTVAFACSDALSGIASCPGPVLVSSEGAGQLVTGTALDKAGNSSTATVPVSLDKTPPAITATITPAPNAAGWNNSNVTVTFTCSDSLSGINTCPTPIQVATEGAGQVISGTASDKAGNTATVSVTVNIDKTPPTITAIVAPAPNGAGWNNSNVMVTFTCSDSLSGIATCPGLVQVTTDGGNQTISGTATDKAGNSTTDSATINLDKTPPTITAAVTPAPNAAGWNNSNTTVTFTCSDPTSGVAACPAPVIVSMEGKGQAISGTAQDKAGNSASATATVNLDKTPPSLTITSPTNGATVNPGSLTVTGTITDDLSGVASVTCQGTPAIVSGSNFSCTVSIVAGPNSITVQASDVAGNTAQSSVSIQGGIPILLSVTPNSGQQGQQNLSVNLTGQFTHWAQGTTTATFGAGITVATLTINFPTSATAVLNIDPAAVVGARNVTLTTGAEVVELTNGFTVSVANRPPIVNAGAPQTTSLGGRIIVGHDVNTLGSFVAGANEDQFAVNLAQWLTGATTGKILAVESSPGDGTRDYAPSVKAALATAGFTVTYISDPSAVSTVTLSNLQQYNAVFVGITWPTVASINTTVLTQYVNSGGNVYIYGGVDGNPAIEAPFLNPFLQAFGLAFDTAAYNGLASVNITSTHPIFTGITGKTLGCGNGQDIHDLGTNPNASIIQFQGQHGVYAVVNGSLALTLNGSVTDDGLPVGATLTTTWNEISGPGSVSFTQPTATFPDVAGQVNPVVTSVAFSLPGTYILGLTATDSQLSSSTSVTVTVSASQIPTLVSVNPSSGQQGQQNLSVNLTGQFTHWVQGTTTANFGPGITVTSLTVNNPTSATADLNIDPGPTGGVALNFFPGSAYNPNTALMDTTLGTSGYVIDSFESATLIPGLTIQLSGSVPTTTWTGLPNLLDENICGSFTSNQAWDGTQTASNDIANQITNCNVDPNVADLTTFYYPPGATSFGIGLSNFQSTNPPSPVYPITNHELFVNGVDMGVLETLAGAAWSPGWTRNAYLRIDGINGGVITSISFRNLQRGAAPDFLMFDHLAVLPGPTGARDVTVTTNAEVVTLHNGFTVQAGSPAVTQINPNAGQQGQQNLTVNLTGQFTHWVQGTTVSSFGAGITVATLTISSPTTATAVLNIDPAASLGARNITMTTGTETVTLNNGFLVTTGAPACVFPPSGLVSWWTGDGTITDKLNANNPSASNAVSFVPGEVGMAFAFGAGGYIDIPPSSSLANQHFTLSAWVRSDGPGPNTDDSVFAEQNVDNTHTAVSLGLRNTDNRFLFIFGDVFSEYIASKDTFAPGQFYLVTGTYDGSTFTLFVNGNLEGQFAEVKTIPYSSNAWTIGATSPNIRVQGFLRTWNGVVDEVQVFNRALSQAEVQAIYAASSAGECKNGAITYVRPNAGQQGQTNLAVTITGQFTHFAQGTSTVSFGPDISVNSLTVVSATSLTATITVPATAVLGEHTVTVTTGNEIASLANGFTVSCAPPTQPPTVSAGPNQLSPIIPDNLLISEWQSNKVVEYTTSGQYVHDFVSAGSPLNGSQNLRFGPDGNLYVTDRSSVKKFDGVTGNYLGDFATGLSIGDTGSDIVFDSAGNAFITEATGNRVSEYSSVGRLVNTFSNGVSTPEGLAFRPNGNLLVTNTYGGTYVNTITELNTTTGGFSTFATGLGEPVGIKAGPDGRYYVTNYTYATVFGGTNPDTVQVIPANGGVSQTFATGTDGASYLLFTDNKLFVTSFYDSRVYSFAPGTGQGLGSFAIPVATREVSGIGVRSSAPSMVFLNGSVLNIGGSSCGQLTSSWSMVSGPGSATFSNPGSPITTANFSTGGVYVLRLTGSDSGLSASSDVTINVSANHPPVVYAGPNQTVGLGSALTLSGRATDDGLPVGGTLTVAWSEVSGPGTVVFSNPGIPNTMATFSAPGTYVLRLVANDSQLSSRSDVMITVGSASGPILLSIVPPSGTQGQQNLSVAITGQNTSFAQGTSQLSFGAGITLTSLSITDATHLLAQITIDPSAAAGLRSVTVTTGAEVATLANGFTVAAISVTPVISTISPTAGPQGQGGQVTVTGLNTHFAQGTSTLDMGPGITVSSVTVTCPTCLSAQVAIATTAPTGPRDVTVTTGTEVVTLTGGFTVLPGTPILTSEVPASGAQGQSLSVAFTGAFTHWAQGTTQVSIGAGITVTSVTVSSGTNLTAQISIDPVATVGPRTPIITTGTEVVSVAGIFSVLQGIIMMTSAPAAGNQAQTLPVTITGQFTHFSQGASVVSFGAGITVGPATVTSSTSLTVQVTIAENAATGPRTVTVTTGTETASAPNAFTVNLGTIILSLNPGGAYQNQTVAVAITGQLTNFVQGTTQASFGPGISVGGAPEGSFGPVTVTGPTAATAQIVVDPAAAPGPRTVQAKTNAELASFTNGFTVVAPFVISSITPNSAQVGQQNLTVAVVGLNTHFVQGSSVLDLAGAGVTVSSVTVTDATHLSAVINIAANAAIAVHDVAVTTGSEFALLKAGFTVTAATGPPSLLSITPNNGQQGQSGLAVAIVGQNTHFTNASTIDLGTGITASGIAATDATHLSANLTIASTAPTGFRTLTVTTGAEVVALANAFGVNLPTNQPPVITIAPTWSVTLPNSLALTYTVTDPGLAVGGTLTVTWSTVSGPGMVGFQNQTPTSIVANFGQPGTYVLQISASDSKTLLIATQSVSVTVGGTLPPAPTVSITSPTEGSSITTQTTVTGSVNSANLASWTLQMRMQTETNYRPIATGTTAVSNGTLGTFDPTLLLNGIALIELTATDAFGQTATFGPVSVVVMGNQKVGNFTLSFNDLTVPLEGLPIQVVRTYDSRNKSLGDFGVGWRLDLNAVTLQTNGALGDNWAETSTGGGFPNYCLQATTAHVVTVSLSDGTTYTFQPTLSPQCQFLLPIQDQTVAVGFAPTGITPPNAVLAIVGDNQPTVTGSVPGPVTLLDLNTFTSFDPDMYQLTLPDGRVLMISKTSGLQTMTDLNGNKITVTPAGIIHSSGKGVSFARDALNRITSITDPAGHSLLYTYNGTGDLVSVQDQVGNLTTFSYDANHGLLTIVDPRGVQPIKNVYDASGRLIQHIDAFGNTINYTNNLSASQEVVTDRLGNVTANYYDANGNIIKVTDALGGNTLRTYDANNNLLTETNPLNETRTYTYDANNNRLTETDPLGNTTTYTYNSRNQVLTVTDALARVTTNTYDANGNLLSTKDPSGNITSYVYNSAGLRTSMTDPLGNVTTYQYDSSGNLTLQTDALGHITRYTYDANGNKLGQTQTRTGSSGSETLVTSYQYDNLNRLVKTTYPDGSTTQIQHNAIGKQSVTTDQLGRQTSYQYDLMGRLIQTMYPDNTTESSTYDAEGDRITSTDRGARTTSYVYDALKRLTQTTYADATSTSTTYDAAGEVTAVKDARGNSTQYKFDTAGRRTQVIDALAHTTTFAYDKVGNQVSMTDANNNTTQYQYDGNNRRTAVVYPDATVDTTAYDNLGRTISKTDQANRITQYAYDKLGRLIQVTDAASQLTTYAYDEVGNRTSQMDANSHTTSSAYDKLGRRTKRTLPLGMAETLTYDAAGNLASHTDFNGKTTAYAYDASNRLLSKTPDASLNQAQVSFTYSAAGQRLSMNDASGANTYAYDQRDRLLQKATPQGTLTYTYDAGGNLASIRSSNSGGVSVNYAYDVLNRVAMVTDNRLTSGTTTYSYDNAGNLQGYVYPNGVQSAFTYSALDRLTNLTLSHGSTLASYAYTLGPAGNRTSVAELGGRQVSYTYDALYRLTGETIAGGTVNGAIGYTYDPVGNRLTRTSTVAPVPPATSTFDANDRLTSDTYDANGNTTASGSNTYGYDFENRLITENGTAVTIVYDGDGNRVAKTVGGATTRYLVDDRNLTGYAQVLEEITNGTVQRVYTYGLNRSSQSQASGTSFYGYDGHGNVRILTDTTGAVTDRYDYDAFGNIISQTGSTPNVYLYSGEQVDANLGLYYLRARYYLPATGRFSTSDPVDGNFFRPLSLHRYIYGSANPISNIDPSGQQELTLEGIDIAVAIQATLATIATVTVTQALAKVRIELPIRLNHYTTFTGLGLILLSGSINSPSGTNFFTPDWYFSSQTAKAKLALSKYPDVFINLNLFRYRDNLIGPEVVGPANGELGGGQEYYTYQSIPLWTRFPAILPVF